MLCLSDVYSVIRSVLLEGLGGRSDSDIWRFAVEQNLCIVTKDLDFAERTFIGNHSVKVIWIRLGNCTTQAAHLVLRNSSSRVASFLESDDLLLELP